MYYTYTYSYIKVIDNLVNYPKPRLIYKYIYIYIFNCLCGSEAKASDTQAVGHGFDPRPDH